MPLARLGTVEVDVGVVVARGLGQPGQERRLGQGQVLGVLAEVDLGGGLDAVGVVPVVDRVEVEPKDVVLGEALLDLGGQDRLLDLADHGASWRSERSGQLLGDGVQRWLRRVQKSCREGISPYAYTRQQPSPTRCRRCRPATVLRKPSTSWNLSEGTGTARSAMMANVLNLRHQLREAGLDYYGDPSAIVCVKMGSEGLARLVSKLLPELGIGRESRQRDSRGPKGQLRGSGCK